MSVQKVSKLLSALIADLDLRNVLPPTSAEEDAALKEAISKEGVIYPLIADEQGKLLDGYRTYAICKELRIKDVWVVTLYGLTDEEKRHKRLALNVNRRHLTGKQKRGLIEQELLRKPAMSAGRLGRLFGVSHNTAQKVKEEMVGTGQIDRCPVEASDGRVFKTSGVLSNLYAIKTVHKKLARENGQVPTGKVLGQTKYERLAGRQRRKLLAEAGAGLPLEPDCRLHCCRFQELLQVEPSLREDATLILTDPPWSKDFLPQIDDLGRLSKEVLRPGGILVCYCGVMYLPQFMEGLGKHLNYVWTVATVHDTCSTADQRGKRRGRLWVYDQWRAALIFVNGQQPTLMDSTLNDWRKGSGPQKEHHDWQQNLDDFKFFIDTFSSRGDLVVDFCGGGFTTAAAAKELQRRFVGCDVTEESVNLGKQEDWAI